MKMTFYLVVKRNGAGRLTKTIPSLVAGEVSIKLQVDIPDKVFVTPMLTANLAIEAEDIKPLEVKVNALRDWIENDTGKIPPSG